MVKNTEYVFLTSIEQEVSPSLVIGAHSVNPKNLIPGPDVFC